jgi:hypothetical protein
VIIQSIIIGIPLFALAFAAKYNRRGCDGHVHDIALHNGFQATLNCIHLPLQGTIIGIPFFAFLRSSANWEEAGEFRPERFLEKDAEIARKTSGAGETSKPGDPADQTGRHIAKALSDADLDRYESRTLPLSKRRKVCP